MARTILAVRYQPTWSRARLGRAGNRFDEAHQGMSGADPRRPRCTTAKRRSAGFLGSDRAGYVKSPASSERTGWFLQHSGGGTSSGSRPYGKHPGAEGQRSGRIDQGRGKRSCLGCEWNLLIPHSRFLRCSSSCWPSGSGAVSRRWRSPPRGRNSAGGGRSGWQGNPTRIDPEQIRSSTRRCSSDLPRSRRHSEATV